MEPASIKRLSRPYHGNVDVRRGPRDPIRWLFQVAITIVVLPAILVVLIVGLCTILLTSGWNAAQWAVENLGTWSGLTPRKQLGIFPAPDQFAACTESSDSEDET
jgi:hypothetical protein